MKCLPANSSKGGALLAFALLFLVARPCAAQPAAPALERFVDVDAQGKLVYETDARGNRIPDYSHAGYGGGGIPIPDVPVRVTVSPEEGGDGARIQAALDFVAGLAPDAQGYRGAVLLGPGRFEISGQLRIQTSGVVLRGSGSETQGTVLAATGNGRRTLIVIQGTNDRRTHGSIRSVTSNYVPAGARQLELDSTDGLSPGDAILVQRPSPSPWIAFMGMGSMPGRPAPTWKPDTMDVVWERRVEAVEENAITLDAPLTCALEREFGGGRVVPYSWPGRLRQVGVENLRCESEWNPANPRDEEHSWMAVTMENVEDAWVRQVTAVHFASSAVSLWETCRRVTVADCASLRPISELGGYRRHSFYTSGQQTLFLRCVAEEGRHDFAAGWLAPGPNAFVDCEARAAHDFSGPIESWANGVLYDSLIMDGGGLRLDHREICDNGVGWAAANCLAWQCSVPVLTARTPPGAQNWAIGCWAQFVGDAFWRSSNEFVEPESLYRAQLRERLGAEALGAIEKEEIPIDPALATPMNLPAKHAPLSGGSGNQDLPESNRPRLLRLTNGWLAVEGQLLHGTQPPITWWRGHAQPNRASDFGFHLTRFVPSRTGPGLTDDLPALATMLANQGGAVLRHHWGLWYDRRRDDHQMIRRMDGDVWPPFFEQPWARSGQGRAWDGLSQYDLARFNPWYFHRLREFARLCEQHGLLLADAMYFQHNLLEAGAHWADFPWRSANNINETGFAEPPPYVNRKRIFMADEFYDVTHPGRRALHRAYIRQCLANLASHPNVLHLLSAEYSGPLPFVQFWLDTIAEWRREQAGLGGKNSSAAPDRETSGAVPLPSPLIGLSAPKDLQDAVLEDAERAALVDVIDFQYWWLSPRGLFAPAGGQNLAPRQHERLWKGGRPTDETLAAMAAEYRARFPNKAVICAFEQAGWAFVCAGGSLPKLPRSTDPELLASIPKMRPVQVNSEEPFWALGKPGSEYLVYAGAGPDARLDLREESGTFAVHGVQAETGIVRPSHQRIAGGGWVALERSPLGSEESSRATGLKQTLFWLRRN